MEIKPKSNPLKPKLGTTKDQLNLDSKEQDTYDI